MSKKQKSTYDEKIIIDEKNKLVFDSEDDVLEHFSKDIAKLEKEFLNLRPKDDYSDDEAAELEIHLDSVLESPDEIWLDRETLKTNPVHIYLKLIENPVQDIYYVALVYVAQEVPTFIFLHFPTKYINVLEAYRRGELIYDRLMNDVELGCVEGDALSEGDEFAVGLFKAMSVLRGHDDISQEEFQSYSELREEAIEEPDEIWRSTDLSGNTLVNFIKDFSMSGEPLYYIAVTLEDESSNSHALLFSFPTNDESLVDRYRHGENLQAEEVVQESSH